MTYLYRRSPRFATVYRRSQHLFNRAIWNLMLICSAISVVSILGYVPKTDTLYENTVNNIRHMIVMFDTNKSYRMNRPNEHCYYPLRPMIIDIVGRVVNILYAYIPYWVLQIIRSRYVQKYTALVRSMYDTSIMILMSAIMAMLYTISTDYIYILLITAIIIRGIHMVTDQTIT